MRHALAKECGLGVIVAHGHKRECSRYLGSFGGHGQGKSEAGFGLNLEVSIPNDPEKSKEE